MLVRTLMSNVATTTVAIASATHLYSCPAAICQSAKVPNGIWLKGKGP